MKYTIKELALDLASALLTLLIVTAMYAIAQG